MIIKTLLARTRSRMWAFVLSFAALPEGGDKGRKHTEVGSWRIPGEHKYETRFRDGWVTTSRNCCVVPQLSSRSGRCRAFKREEKAIAAHCQVRLSFFRFLLRTWIVHQSLRQIVEEPAKPCAQKGCLNIRKLARSCDQTSACTGGQLVSLWYADVILSVVRSMHCLHPVISQILSFSIQVSSSLSHGPA